MIINQLIRMTTWGQDITPEKYVNRHGEMKVTRGAVAVMVVVVVVGVVVV